MKPKKATGVRNNLEKFAWDTLTKEGIDFKYEPYSIELSPAFVLSAAFIEHEPKKFRQKTNKVLSITYKPDFVGDKWLMETKGLRRPGFDVRWKLFKKYLKDNNLDWLILMPSNQEEVLTSIQLIKEYIQKRNEGTEWDWGVLQIPKILQQHAQRSTESKTARAEKKASRTVRTRRQHSP